MYENFEISKINNFNTSIDKKKKTKHKNQRKDLKFNLSLTNITSSLIILIITFVSIILILDTFKNNISIYIPILIPLIESLYETLRDINFFIVDLIT